MKKIISLFISALALTCACGGSDNEEKKAPVNPQEELEGELAAEVPAKTNDMTVFAHYMPWWETPSTSADKSWGWHWTMGNSSINPANGNIASHYHPLTGPYASSDTNILDYQCLLMKYSGIDGVIIDWMGTSGKNDFGPIHTNTQAMVAACTRNGLKFAICYDEQTALGDNVFSNNDDRLEQARTDMRQLKNLFIAKSNYAKYEGKPVVLFFGPAKLKGASYWQDALKPLGDAIVCLLNGHSSAMNEQLATGEFSWVNPNPDYSKVGNKELYIAGAMPGFHDYYREAGLGYGYTTYNDEGGALFDRQLAAAKGARMKWLQISTWNDYGEGTIIEPTQEFKYRYLTKLQTFSGISYREADLKLINQWYTLTMSKTDKQSQTLLRQCYYYLRALKADKARALISKI